MVEFDVFLAHNSQDKPQIIEIAQHLKQKGLKPWLDKEQILGGETIVEKVIEGIKQSKTGAFFISPNGLGNFQENIELFTVINWFLTPQRKSQGFRVIPILLPGVAKIPDKIDHLAIWRWIQFTKSNDEEALDDLIRSIRGRDTEVKAQSVIQTPDIPNRNQPKPQASQKDDDLASEKGIDYTRLRNLLAGENWKEADKETYLMMLQAVGKEDGDYFEKHELLYFPCTDLRTIDRLWVKYSNGHFGFSVQKEIYLSVGGKADDNYYQEAWDNFGDCVGWTVIGSALFGSKVDFYDTSSPRGHFPWWGGSDWQVRGGVSWGLLLFSRFETCLLWGYNSSLE